MKANGIIIKNLEREYYTLIMEINMKENLKMINSKEKELIITIIMKDMKELGVTECAMELELIILIMVIKLMAILIKIKQLVLILENVLMDNYKLSFIKYFLKEEIKY